MTHPHASQIRTGLILITIGLLFLVGQFEWFPLTFGKIWPYFVVALGVGLLCFPGDDGGRSGAWWLIFVGGIFLLHTYGVASLRDTWPLFIVASGISLMTSGPGRQAARKDR